MISAKLWKTFQMLHSAFLCICGPTKPQFVFSWNGSIALHFASYIFVCFCNFSPFKMLIWNVIWRAQNWSKNAQFLQKFYQSTELQTLTKMLLLVQTALNFTKLPTTYHLQNKKITGTYLYIHVLSIFDLEDKVEEEVLI